MFLMKIYFILGLAMLLIVLWDYKFLSRTASRLIKTPEEKMTGFSQIANSIRNLALMAFFAFFLWPVVVWWELSGKKEK
jgi:hypothetical protein